MTDEDAPKSGPDSYGLRPEGAEASDQGKTKKIRQASKENEKLAQIIARADRFSELKGHPVWAELYQEVKDKRKVFAAQIASTIASGNDVDMVSVKRTIDRLKGAEWILSHPEEAEKSLEKASMELLLRDEYIDEED